MAENKQWAVLKFPVIVQPLLGKKAVLMMDSEGFDIDLNKEVLELDLPHGEYKIVLTIIEQ